MNIEEKEKEKEKVKTNKNELEQEESSLEEQDDNSSIEEQNIILGYDEHPGPIIEKILIKIFNNIITNRNNSEKYIQTYQKKIKDLCTKYQKIDIILFLLTNIKNVIKKYRKKIFEIPSIEELRENDFQKYYFRSYSINEKYSKMYINFGIDRFAKNYRASPRKHQYLDYYVIIKNLFNKLKGIKNCLEKAAPIIEKIFEYPLSEYNTFTILECEKREFYKILIHDNFIWNEIIKNKNTKLNSLIKEIIQDDYNNLNIIKNKSEYINNYDDKLLKISEVGSSLDERFPEDAKPVTEIKYKFKGYYDNKNNLINEDENNIFFNAKEDNVDSIDINIEENFFKDNNFTNINMINFSGKNIKNINK